MLTDTHRRQPGTACPEERRLMQLSHHHIITTMNPRQPAQWFVTAGSQRGSISYDGYAESSTVWRGGAAYVQMCLTCGLEPGRVGYVSNCLCLCKRCCRVLHGHGDESRLCDNCGGGRPVITSIGTVEVKAKRPRSTYQPRCARPCLASPAPSPVAACPVPAPVALAAELLVASAVNYLGYGHYCSFSYL
jgi:hypothetical protein